MITALPTLNPKACEKFNGYSLIYFSELRDYGKNKDSGCIVALFSMDRAVSTALAPHQSTKFSIGSGQGYWAPLAR